MTGKPRYDISTHGNRMRTLTRRNLTATNRNTRTRISNLKSRLLAVAMLLPLAAAATAATVVTDRVQSEGARAQTDLPVTFGQVFKAGDVPRGQTVTATLDGKPIELQVDAKATNPDGSLRHAVLTVRVPALGGRADLPLALSTAPAEHGAGAAVSIEQLLATPYAASISLEFGGVRYTANVRPLLQAAAKARSCKPWGTACNQWLSGPLASEWVVHGPVVDASGKANPSLSIWFAVRAYAGSTPGSVGEVRTDITVENSWAYGPQAQPQYTATLASGKASYTSPALTQYAYTRWHHVLWWNDVEPQVYLRQDTQYIQDSKAVSRYMQLKPDAAFLASVRQTCAPLDHCDQTAKMHMTGAQAAIGPLPRWTSVYIVDPDVRAYRWMLANNDALGAYSIHLRDQSTSWPLSIRKHPNVTEANWASAHKASDPKVRADQLASCVNNAVVKDCDHPWYSTGNPFTWDNAHQPAESYVAYMVTGSWYYMSELAFGASHNEIWSNEGYRGFSKGLINESHGQVRGKAWVLREMANAAWLLPDAHPLKAEFIADVENSLADWNAKYTRNHDANPLGLMTDGPVYNMNGGKRNGTAPWQHSFLTWSAGHAAELGFAGAAEFRDWLAKFEIGLMTDWQSNPTHGYCWLHASAYVAQVKDTSGNWLPNYTAVYAATFPTLVGLACNSPAMVAATSTLRKKAWKIGEMYGYPYSATGFPSNLQVGLASAADSGLPNAKAAWELFESRSVKPTRPDGYDNYPNFAVLPRSLGH